MLKSTFWIIVAVLCVYFSLVLCEGYGSVQELRPEDSQTGAVTKQHELRALQEEGRTRKIHRYHWHSLWGFYGLAIAYLIKVKVVVVAFFVGSAVYLGLRYLWPHKCAGSEFYKEGSVILDHPPSFAHHDHHDHIPYSLDHEHYDTSGTFASSGPASYEPYSAYSGHPITETDNSFPTGSFTGPDGVTGLLPADAPSFRRKRSASKELKQKTNLLENLARQMLAQEERIGEFMLNFLGLDTIPCRRRFICEMEFKSKLNPLTAMAFRVIGRSLFARYTNKQNPLRKASSFEECADVNAECLFIENNEAETEVDNTIDESQPAEWEEQASYTNQLNTEQVTSASFVENNDIIEQANESNLRAELRTSLRKRLRGDRHLKLI